MIVWLVFLLFWVAILLLVVFAGSTDPYEDRQAKYALTRQYNRFLEMLARDEAFGFAHYNDGEIECVGRTDEFYWRGWSSQGAWIDRCDQTMKNQLKDALMMDEPNWWVGTPCEHHEKHRIWLNRLNIPTTREVLAMVFHHNYHRREELFHVWDERVAKGHRVHVVCSDRADPAYLVTRWSAHIYRVPFHYAQKQVDAVVEDLTSKVKPNDIVLLFCGPLGRIVAPKVFKQCDQVTVLCLGSFMDCYLYHDCVQGFARGEHPYCKMCYPWRSAFKFIYNERNMKL